MAKKSLGLSLVVETLAFLMFLGILVGLGIYLYKGYEKASKIQEVKTEMGQIFDFVKALYMSNLYFVKNSCYGFANCKYTLTPEPVDDTTFRVHIANLSLLNMLRGYCKIEQTGDSQYDITCYSAYSGQPLIVDIQNYQRYQKPFLAPYYGKYTSITLIEPSLNFNATLVFDNEINKSLFDTGEILKSFKQKTEEWAKRRLDLATGNDCGSNSTSTTDPAGGLGSWDDVLIPWIWQALGYSPFTFTSRGRIPTLCQGIDSGCQCGSDCGCQNFENNPDVWRNDSNLCQIHDANELGRFLDHIGLNPDRYMTDGFGNLLTFVPLSDSSGNPSRLCPPPPPACCYRYDIPKKGTVGIYDYDNNRWAYRVEIIYP